MKPRRRSDSEASSSDGGVRLGCGALLGILVGISLVISFFALESGAVICGVIIVSIVSCAVLGYLFGDRFFHSAASWIRWF